MCGIAGVLAGRNELDEQTIRTMVGALRHRGPDDTGWSAYPCDQREAWLGSTRLAIVDLSAAGHMPMVDAAGRAIVHNGEVYNFPTLRTELEAHGPAFRSGTDTEVILRLIAEFGPDAIERMRGMFAFAVWDPGRAELLLARDRAGKKPLYYAHTPAGFVFASEIRSILATGLVERRLDPIGLDIYLTNGFSVPPRTIVSGINALMPGQWMRVRPDGQILEQRAYWHPPTFEAATPAHAARSREAALQAFLEAVEMRLISDVPLGVFLSGGLDSSAITAAVRRSATDVRTFAVAFPDTDLDESAHARRVAEDLGTLHTEVPIDRATFFEQLPSALEAIDQPTFDGINTYFVARAAREGGLTVALSGLGADELFGGYPFFRSVPLLARLQPFGHLNPYALGSRLAEGLGRTSRSPAAGVWKAAELVVPESNLDVGPDIPAYQAAQTQFPSWIRDRLLSSAVPRPIRPPFFSGLPDAYVDLLQRESDGRGHRDAISLLAFRLFMGARTLPDTDTMSMAVSLEVRAPFVDHVFVERAFALDPESRTRGAPDKPGELDLLRPIVGDAWKPRRKQGFVVPFNRWLNSAEGQRLVEPTFRDAAMLQTIGLDPGMAGHMWKLHRERPTLMPWSRVWAIHVLANWAVRHGMTIS